MALDNIVYYCVELALLGLEDSIRQILTGNRLVCRNFNNVKLINLPELLFLGHSRTGHTGELFVKAEVVLECYCSERLALVCNLNAFLSLNSLMQTLVIASAVHKAACEFVNDNNLVVLDNIVNIPLHNAVSLDSLIYVVLNCEVIRIGEVVNAEVLLSLFNAERSQRCRLSLFVNYIFNSVFLVVFVVILFAVDFGKLLALHSSCKSVCSLVQIGGLIALTGNNKRSSGFINED